MNLDHVGSQLHLDNGSTSGHMPVECNQDDVQVI